MAHCMHMNVAQQMTRWANHQKALSPARSMVLSFLVLILFGSALLMLPISATADTSIRPIEALFTATSAVCVTGLVVLDTGSDFSRFGQVVLLFLFQLGGLGIMLFSSALVGAFGRRLALRERVHLRENIHGVPLSEVGRLGRDLVVFTLGCEALGFAFLWCAWFGTYGADSAFLALFHSVSAFCNAGFSLWPDSLLREVANPLVNSVIVLLIFIGGLGFLTCRDMAGSLRSGERTLVQTRLVVGVSAGLILLGTLGFYYFERQNPETLGPLSMSGRWQAALFQSVTARTAGFNTVDIGALRGETVEMMIFLMFVGGSPGSTAGGVKTTTFILLLLAAWAQIRGRREVVVMERSIPIRRVVQALALVVVAAGTFLLVSLILNHLEASPFSVLLFEAVSALGTVGLSMGVTGHLSDPSLLLLCLAMFAGRVGPLTLAVSLVSRPASGVRYPATEVAIG